VEDYLAFRNLGLLRSKGEERAFDSAHQLQQQQQDASKFSILCHVDWEGKFDASVLDVVGKEVEMQLVGREVLGDGAKEVIDALEVGGRLVGWEDVKHRYPYDWKTKRPVIVR
jgi:isoleucyl-tRNA synthetase